MAMLVTPQKLHIHQLFRWWKTTSVVPEKLGRRPDRGFLSSNR